RSVTKLPFSSQPSTAAPARRSSGAASNAPAIWMSREGVCCAKEAGGPSNTPMITIERILISAPPKRIICRSFRQKHIYLVHGFARDHKIRTSVAIQIAERQSMRRGHRGDGIGAARSRGGTVDDRDG